MVVRVVRDVALDVLVPTRDNRRRIREDSGEFQEFVENIRTMGVLEPGLCRPHPVEAGKLELRAGERRWRACRLAGFATMPVIVREMTDEEALAVTVAENLQRENLHPLEEGETLALMLERGWTAEQAANQLGRSKKWVLRRARLTELTEAWREAVTNPGEAVSRWSASHLELIARYPAETQERLAREFLKVEGYRYDTIAGTSLHELREELANYLQELSLAPWDLNAADVAPGCGPCVGCAKRSDVQPELWDSADYGSAGPGARCLDGACWDAKGEAFLKGRLAELEAKHGRVVCLIDGWSVYGYHGPFEVAPGREYVGCKKKDAGAVMCLWVDGPKAGRSYWARSARGGNGRDGQDGPGEKAKRPLAERRAQLERVRCRMVNEKIAARLEGYTMEDDGPPKLSSNCVLRLAIEFGTAHRWDGAGKHHDGDSRGMVDPWERMEARARGPLALGDELAEELLLSIVPVLKKRVLSENQENDFRKPVEPSTVEGRAVCDLFGLDWDGLYAEARREKPEPKSWKREAASEGTEGAEEEGEEESGQENRRGEVRCTALEKALTGLDSWPPAMFNEHGVCSQPAVVTIPIPKKLKVEAVVYVARRTSTDWRAGLDCNVLGSGLGCAGTGGLPSMNSPAYSTFLDALKAQAGFIFMSLDPGKLSCSEEVESRRAKAREIVKRWIKDLCTKMTGGSAAKDDTDSADGEEE